jgi:sialate O-acetylesterase
VFTNNSKKSLVSTLSISLSICAACRLASADVSLAPGFSDHMVLQRDMPVPIRGKASAGEAVTVTFRGQTKNAAAGADGNWKVAMDPGLAGGPFPMTIQGKNTLSLTDVMVGEVWLAGGQSNMAFPMKTIAGPNLDSAQAADYPNLRIMNFQGDKKWKACTPATALEFSATAYYFGRDLQQTLKVPVGILLSAVGGTEIERWMDPVSIAADPLLAKDTAAGILYDKWIAPIIGFGIKGTIWYQGEFNATTNSTTHPNWVVSHYHARFQALIQGWRKVWGQGETPFYFVQLPNINGLQTNAGDSSPWAELREAQRLTLSVANTAMAVTIDIGEADNLHPYDKWDVGKRLTLIARAREYGEKGLIYASPLFQSMQIQGKAIRLFFRNADGLAVKGGAKAAGFAIAGADNKWSWADVTIAKDTVIVSSSTVAAPAKVRYGWGQNPPCNLYNGAGLPMSPFQTDGPQLPVGLARNGYGEGPRGRASRDFLISRASRFSTWTPVFSGFDLAGRPVEDQRR